MSEISFDITMEGDREDMSPLSAHFVVHRLA